MEKELFKGRIETNFKGKDPLWEKIVELDLEEHLITDNYLEFFDPEKSYRLNEVAPFFTRQDYILRNILNQDKLDGYIKPHKRGKIYYLDFKSIFRYNMIFILTDKANKQLTDIKNYLGITPDREVDSENRKSFRPANKNGNTTTIPNNSGEVEDLKKELENIRTVLAMMKMEQELEKVGKLVEVSKQKVREWEHNTSLLEQKITSKELIRNLKINERKNIELIKKTQEETNKDRGFLSIFTRPKKIDVDKMYEEVAVAVEENKKHYSEVDSLTEEIHKLKMDIEERKLERKELLADQKKYEEKYDAKKEEIELFKERLNSLSLGSDNKKALEVNGIISDE